MKKRSIIITAFLILTVLIFLSCKKDNNSNNNKINNFTIQTFKNKETNPYDSCGIIHNDVLSAIGNMPNFPYISSENTDVYMLDYMVSKGYCDSDLELSYLDSIGEVLNSYHDIASYSNQLFNDNLIEINQLNYLNKLNEIIVASIDNNSVYNIEICDLEISLSKDNGLTDDAKAIVWGALSIARYSGNFWNDALYNKENPWHLMFVTNGKEYHGNAVGEACADVCGWIGGWLGPRHGAKRTANANANSERHSKRYVEDHTDRCYDANGNLIPCK